MKLSTSTGILHEGPYGKVHTVIEMMRESKSVGFQHLDFNFYDWHKKGSPLLSDDWKGWIEAIAEESDRLDIDFPQAHACFYPFLDEALTRDEKEYLDKIVDRSILCASILKVETIVTHPDTFISRRDLSLKGNINYLSKYIDKTSKFGMRLAIENMWESENEGAKFCSQPDELVNLVDCLGAENAGICWDFEHAAIMKQNSADIVRMISNRLFATHVSDTHSDTDYTLMHILPLLGPIEWAPIMKALRDIGYRGFFSFEVSHYMNYMPNELVHSALSFAYDVGNYLIEFSGRE